MTGEYIRKGRPCRFVGWMEGVVPPDTVTLTTRSCPKSPAVELTLAFVAIDQERQIALYEVKNEKPVD